MKKTEQGNLYKILLVGVIAVVTYVLIFNGNVISNSALTTTTAPFNLAIPKLSVQSTSSNPLSPTILTTCYNTHTVYWFGSETPKPIRHQYSTLDQHTYPQSGAPPLALFYQGTGVTNPITKWEVEVDLKCNPPSSNYYTLWLKGGHIATTFSVTDANGNLQTVKQNDYVLNGFNSIFGSSPTNSNCNVPCNIQGTVPKAILIYDVSPDDVQKVLGFTADLVSPKFYVDSAIKYQYQVAVNYGGANTYTDSSAVTYTTPTLGYDLKFYARVTQNQAPAPVSPPNTSVGSNNVILKLTSPTNGIVDISKPDVQSRSIVLQATLPNWAVSEGVPIMKLFYADTLNGISTTLPVFIWQTQSDYDSVTRSSNGDGVFTKTFTFPQSAVNYGQYRVELSHAIRTGTDSIGFRVFDPTRVTTVCPTPSNWNGTSCVLPAVNGAGGTGGTNTYVCSDGTKVSDPTQCKTIGGTTTYICSDNTKVSDPTQCKTTTPTSPTDILKWISDPTNQPAVIIAVVVLIVIAVVSSRRPASPRY